MLVKYFFFTIYSRLENSQILNLFLLPMWSLLLVELVVYQGHTKSTKATHPTHQPVCINLPFMRFATLIETYEYLLEQLFFRLKGAEPPWKVYNQRSTAERSKGINQIKALKMKGRSSAIVGVQ